MTRYKTKKLTVEIFQFDGSLRSFQDISDRLTPPDAHLTFHDGTPRYPGDENMSYMRLYNRDGRFVAVVPPGYCIVRDTAKPYDVWACDPVVFERMFCLDDDKTEPSSPRNAADGRQADAPRSDRNPRRHPQQAG